MVSNISQNILHFIASGLLQPVIWALLFFTLLALYEVGIACGEAFGGIRKHINENDLARLMNTGKKRIERADFITRLSPMLGLMGTLIPLGPGLAALGDGELRILTTAITVAFDTTVIGLLVGMIGFVLGRLRRRWYDHAIEQVQQRGAPQFKEQTEAVNNGETPHG